ncbi:8550_t:CDS:1 [Funneliformis mosseae]|uniref:8550_t:CDS:1 n=1 Tax=Funneliformis mosseae TaxID=27381 RepID=A0A9N9G9Q2_FUNMO|nr:8550_t:CDS:1 [Funneliformis mosseae]
MKKFLFTSLFFAATAMADVLSDVASNPITMIESLSPSCQASLLSIVANPEFFECVPIPALLPLLPVLTDPTAIPKMLQDPAKNIPPIFGPVFDGICAAPKCSDEGVAASLKALNDGCQADEKNLIIEIATAVVTFYSPLRDTICFKDKKQEYCVFETLDKVTALPKPPFKLIDGGLIDSIALAEPKEICTPCNKAIINTIFNFLNADTNHSVEYLGQLGVPPLFLQIGKLFIGVKCGIEFLDGNVGKPEDTDPDDFNYQLSQGTYGSSGASNVKGSLTMMIGASLASVFLF